MPDNVPEPVDTTVPSARAERRRIWWDDVSGVTLYAVMAGAAAVALLVAGLLGAR